MAREMINKLIIAIMTSNHRTKLKIGRLRLALFSPADLSATNLIYK